MANPMMRARVREEDGEYAGEPLSALECVLERITFHNTENGYSVVRVAPSDNKSVARGEIVTVLGNF